MGKNNYNGIIQFIIIKWSSPRPPARGTCILRQLVLNRKKQLKTNQVKTKFFKTNLLKTDPNTRNLHEQNMTQ